MKKNALHEAVLELGQDAEYMSKKMINIFKLKAEREHAEINILISNLENTHRNSIHDRSTDAVDQAQQQTAQNTMVFDIKKAKKRLQKINLALRFINQGDYGYCIECGDEIGVDRMSIDPTHIRDATCATREEKKTSQRRFASV